MAPKNNLPTPFLCLACNQDGKPFQTDKTNARSVLFLLELSKLILILSIILFRTAHIQSFAHVANVLAVRKWVGPAALTVNGTDREAVLIASADSTFKDGAFDPRDEVDAVQKGIDAFELRGQVCFKKFFYSVFMGVRSFFWGFFKIF